MKRRQFHVAELHACHALWTITLEISRVDGAVPIQGNRRSCRYDYRTLGLGYANIGGLLMDSGYAYDSDRAARSAARLRADDAGRAYATVAEDGVEIGAFPAMQRNAEHMLRVIRNHRVAAHGESEATKDLAINPVAVGSAALSRQAVGRLPARLGIGLEAG